MECRHYYLIKIYEESVVEQISASVQAVIDQEVLSIISEVLVADGEVPGSYIYNPFILVVIKDCLGVIPLLHGIHKYLLHPQHPLVLHPADDVHDPLVPCTLPPERTS